MENRYFEHRMRNACQKDDKQKKKNSNKLIDYITYEILVKCHVLIQN